MKILTTLSALFIIGGSTGWLIELVFRRIAHGKWINPGFLSGPCLPLYGFGVLVLYAFCSFDLSFIHVSMPCGSDMLSSSSGSPLFLLR